MSHVPLIFVVPLTDFISRVWPEWDKFANLKHSYCLSFNFFGLSSPHQQYLNLQSLVIISSTIKSRSQVRILNLAHQYYFAKSYLFIPHGVRSPNITFSIKLWHKVTSWLHWSMEIKSSNFHELATVGFWDMPLLRKDFKI